jgi:hypothetical protein
LVKDRINQAVQFGMMVFKTLTAPSGGGGHASGGYISGSGTATSDSIPAMLSNGEYVVKASVVSRLGRGYFDGLNFGHSGSRMPRFAVGGFVSERLRLTTPGAAPQSSAASARDRRGVGDVIISPGAIVINQTGGNPFDRRSQGQMEMELARAVQRGMRRL